LCVWGVWRRYDIKSKKSTLRAALAEGFDAPTADWLLREMAENRESKVASKKGFDMRAIRAAATSGGLPIGEDAAAVAAAPHCAWGTAQLLRLYRDDPTLLDPQGAAP
jgi:hypothetical protein